MAVYDLLRATLEQYFLDNYVEPAIAFPVPEIQWEGREIDPEGLDEWVATNFQVSTDNQETITGSPTSGGTQVGLFTFQMFGKIDDTMGVGAVWRRIDEICALFIQKRVLITGTSENIIFSRPRPVSVGLAPVNVGPWFQINLICPWHHHE